MLDLNNDIIENNKLIGKFIGFYFRDDGNNICQPPRNWITGNPNMTYDPKKYLKFHESWDWLMPVVEKIEDSGIKITISGTECEIKTVYFPGYHTSACYPQKNKIKMVYDSVVMYIKYINDINNNNNSNNTSIHSNTL